MGKWITMSSGKKVFLATNNPHTEAEKYIIEQENNAKKEKVKGFTRNGKFIPTGKDNNANRWRNKDGVPNTLDQIRIAHEEKQRGGAIVGEHSSSLNNQSQITPEKMNQYLSQFKTKESRDNAIAVMAKMYGLD